MSRTGQVLTNPVTGERAVVLVGTEDGDGESIVVDLYVRPGGAVAGEHVHPSIEESFTVLRGRVGFSVAGRKQVAEPGRQLHVPAGVAHDWWNAGDEEAHVRVEVRPGARFEEMIQNFFGLAHDGRTDSKGMPHFLQLALFALEFDDVIRFTRPPRLVQRTLFRALAPLARLRGYRGRYARYSAEWLEARSRESIAREGVQRTVETAGAR